MRTPTRDFSFTTARVAAGLRRVARACHRHSWPRSKGWSHRQPETGQWAYSDASLLNDVTVGKNEGTASGDTYGSCTTVLAYLCIARAGYDGPTGNGSIDGDMVTGGPGMGGPDCAASSCGSGSSGYASSALTATTATLEAAVYRYGLYHQLLLAVLRHVDRLRQPDGHRHHEKGVSGTVSIKSILQGLSATTTYYYRLVATNADGTVYGYTFSTHDRGTPRANTASPSVSGAAQQGVLLTANVGTWTPKPTKYKLPVAARHGRRLGQHQRGDGADLPAGRRRPRCDAGCDRQRNRRRRYGLRRRAQPLPRCSQARRSTPRRTRSPAAP